MDIFDITAIKLKYKDKHTDMYVKTCGTEALGALILHKCNKLVEMEGGEKGLGSQTQPLISGPEGGFQALIL